jgi:hypothetical protein
MKHPLLDDGLPQTLSLSLPLSVPLSVRQLQVQPRPKTGPAPIGELTPNHLRKVEVQVPKETKLSTFAVQAMMQTPTIT